MVQPEPDQLDLFFHHVLYYIRESVLYGGISLSLNWLFLALSTSVQPRVSNS